MENSPRPRPHIDSSTYLRQLSCSFIEVYRNFMLFVKCIEGHCQGEANYARATGEAIRGIKDGTREVWKRTLTLWLHGFVHFGAWQDMGFRWADEASYYLGKLLTLLMKRDWTVWINQSSCWINGGVLLESNGHVRVHLSS